MLNPTGVSDTNPIASTNAETATSGSQMTISGTLQDSAGNPVSGAMVAIQDYDVVGGASSNNVSNDAFVLNGTTTLFSAVNYPTVTTDSNGNFSVTVTANVPVTQSITQSVTNYYALYVPSTVAITSGQSLPPTGLTSLTFVGDNNATNNFVDIAWQQGLTAQTIGVSHTSLMPSYSTLSAVPQTMSFSNVVGSHEQMYAAAFNQTGTIIAPAAGNQFAGYALTYDLTAPTGTIIETLGTQSLANASGKGVTEVKAHYLQSDGILVLDSLLYTDGTTAQATYGSNGKVTAPLLGLNMASAYDGSGQINFYLNSDPNSTTVVTSGTAGSVNVNIAAYANSLNGLSQGNAEGSASGTINAAFNASNSIGSLAVAADPTGFNQYNPLLAGNAAPGATVTVAGVAIPAANAYDISRNAAFVAAPFNSYPALSTVPSQGLTMNMGSSLNGTISNVDGYTLASMPTNATYNVNSAGEVSVNNVKLWQVAQQGYRVVGYLADPTSGTLVNGAYVFKVTLIEQNTAAPTNFYAYQVTSVGSAGSAIATSWTLPTNYLAQNYEEYLGFNVGANGALQPLVASYYANNNNSFAPYTGTSSVAVTTNAFTPVEVASAYASDKYSENPVVTVSNSLNSKTATVTENFTAATGGLVAVKASLSSVNSVLGGSQNLTFTAQDAYGNPISNQTLYVGTGTPGLWITQVNGNVISSSVNMGTTSSTSMQTVNTPIPLYQVSTDQSQVPAYDSASVTGITAYSLQTAPVVALTTGVDGTVSITLVDGNVTYVRNASTNTDGTNSGKTNAYQVNPGTPITSTPLALYSDPAKTNKLGSVLVNWSGVSSANVLATGVTLSSPLTLAVGTTGTLTPTVLPTTATNKAVTWISNNPAVATVSGGVVTAVSVGQATITATTADASKMTATSTVTVVAAGSVLISAPSAKFDGMLFTNLTATVSSTVTSVSVIDTTKNTTLAASVTPANNSITSSLIGAAKGDVLTLTPYVGATAGATVSVTVQ